MYQNGVSAYHEPKCIEIPTLMVAKIMDAGKPPAEIFFHTGVEHALYYLIITS